MWTTAKWISVWSWCSCCILKTDQSFCIYNAHACFNAHAWINSLLPESFSLWLTERYNAYMLNAISNTRDIKAYTSTSTAENVIIPHMRAEGEPGNWRERNFPKHRKYCLYELNDARTQKYCKRTQSFSGECVEIYFLNIKFHLITMSP